MQTIKNSKFWIVILTFVIMHEVKYLYALPPTWSSSSYGVCDGTETAGVDLLYQYAPTTAGNGYIANGSE